MHPEKGSRDGKIRTLKTRRRGFRLFLTYMYGLKTSNMLFLLCHVRK